MSAGPAPLSTTLRGLAQEEAGAAPDSLAARLVPAAAGAGEAHGRDRVDEAARAVELLDRALGMHDRVIARDPGEEQGQVPGAAALGGAWLLGRATELVAACGDDAAAIWGEAAYRMVRARMTEFEDLYDAGRPAARYFAVSEMRSGSLFSLAARLGAHLGAGEEPADALGEYGRELGVAAEIRADVLALEAGPGWERVAAGSYPLPILHALDSDPELASALGKPLEGAELARVAERVRAAGGIERASDDCVEHARAASAALSEVEAAQPLAAIADRVPREGPEAWA